MNRDYNRVIIYGNLVKDPEIKTFEDGSKAASIVVASTRSWQDETGTKHEKTSFIECRASKGRADILANNFYKGRPILIEGRLEQDRWVDKETQKKMSKLRVVIEDIRFTDPKSKWDNSDKKEVSNGDDINAAFDDDTVDTDNALDNILNENNEK